MRGNMMSMVEQQVTALKANARKELDELDGDYEDDSGDPEERRRVRSEIDAIFRGATAPAKTDVRAEDLEIYPGDFKVFDRNGNATRAAADGDVDMTGTDSKPRTARMVWEALGKDILDLVDKASSEIVAYDRHAQNTINLYKQALERRTGKQIPPPIATGINGGILRNRTEESPIDMNAFRRMSTGMPIVGLPSAQPGRAYEKMDEIARRGSNSK